jgi:hypothetical protein
VASDAPAAVAHQLDVERRQSAAQPDTRAAA